MTPRLTLQWLVPVLASAQYNRGVFEPIPIIIGPSGAQGAKGDKGDPGTGNTFSYSPPSAQSTWLVAHNLGRHPSVTVTIDPGEEVGVLTTYLDANTVSIDFGVPVLGTAYLN